MKMHIKQNVIDTMTKNISAMLCGEVYSCIHVSDRTDANVDAMGHVLYLINKKKFNKHRDYTNYSKNNKYEMENNTSYIIPFPRYHSFLWVRAWCEINSHTDNQFRNIHIQIYGKYHRLIKKKLIEKVNFLKQSTEIHVQNVSSSGGLRHYDHAKIFPSTFDDVILPSAIKQKLLNRILQWERDKKWYHNHALIHKLGILLHGQPGSGKSSITKAISHHFFNAPILYINDINEYTMTSIREFRNTYDGVFIVLLEDIDMLLLGKLSNRSLTTEEQLPLPQQLNIARENNKQRLLFQILDGLYSMEDIIYIATTNYIDQLDEGLIRPGRFDIKLEIPYFEKQQAIQMCHKFGYGEELLDTLNITYPVQPSKLQSMILGVRTAQFSKEE